jgi:hypothetical protein
MKIPLLKRDAAARQRAETASCATASAKLAELRAERERILHADHDDLSKVIAIDAAVSPQEKICAVHQERLAAISRELARERQGEREKRKVAAVADVEKHFAAQTARAAEMEKAVAHLSECAIRYREAVRDTSNCPWPHDLLPDASDRYSPYRRNEGDNIFQQIAAALRIEPGSVWGALPEAGKRVAGMAERSAEAAAAFIANLRDAPLPEVFDNNDEAAA